MTFRHLAPSDLPPPKQGCCSAGDGLVAYAKAFAKCRNVLGSMESWRVGSSYDPGKVG